MRQMSFDISSMYLSFICFMQSKRLDKLWLNGSLYRVIGFIAKTLSHITLPLRLRLPDKKAYLNVKEDG